MFKLPSSPVTDFLIMLISALPDLSAVDKLIKRNRKISKGKSAMKYKTDGKTLFAEKQNGSEQIQLRLDNYGSLPSVKLILFLLTQINKLAITDTNVVAYEIEFNINELVKCGMYKSVTSAKKALQTLDRITDIYFRGIVRCEELKTVTEWQKPIETVSINKRKVTARLNRDFPWEVLTRYYMNLPEQAFSLGRRGFILLYYCCFLARQNTSEIRRYGSFGITLRAVQSRLNLPDENGTKNPKILIKQPIINAADEINALNCGIKMKLFADENGRTDSFLDNGKIKVYFDDSAKESLPDMKTMKKRAKKK